MSLLIGTIARERLTVIALLVSIFMAGALSALVVAELVDRREGAAFASPTETDVRPAGPGRRGLPPGPRGLASLLEQPLDLTPEQRSRIDLILERRRARTDSVMEAMRRPLEAQLDSTHAEIREVLRPEQRRLFDRIIERSRARREQRPPPL